MIVSGDQNKFPSSFAPLGDLFKASCSFRTWTVSILPPHCRFKGLIKGKVLPRCGRKRAPSDSITFFSLFMFLFLHNLYVLHLFWVSLVLCFTLFNMFLFVWFQFCFILFFIKIKKLKNQKIQKQCVFCVHWYLCILDSHWNKIF